MRNEMNIKAVGFAALLPLLLVVAGCATEEPKPYSGLQAAGKLEKQTSGPAEYLYKAPGADFKKYTKFMIPPTTIYQGSDAQFGDATEEQKQEMADYITSTFTKVLQDGGYPVVTQSGPDVADLKFTLAGIEMTHPAGATVTHLLPIGVVVNLGKGAAGSGGSFMGAVLFAGEIYDSDSDKLIAAFVTKQYASALDYTELTSKLGSAKAGVDKAAKDFLERINKIQGRTSQ